MESDSLETRPILDPGTTHAFTKTCASSVSERDAQRDAPRQPNQRHMSTQRLARWIGSTPLPDEQLGWKAHRNHISPTRQTPKRILDPSPRASQPTARLHRSAHPSPATRRILPGRSERENVDSLKNSCREIKPDPDLTQRPRSPTNQGRLLGRFTLVAICLDDQSDSSARMSLPLLPPSFPFQKTQVDRPDKSGQPGKVSVGAQLHPPPHGRQADLLHSLPAHDSKSVRAFFQMQVRGYGCCCW